MEDYYWAQESEVQLQQYPWLLPSPVEERHHHHHHRHRQAPTPLEEEDRATCASRSHSEAEKRRRDRINAQLATLRKLIPMSEKMDKAALLGHVVEHVKEQRVRVKEVMSKSSTVPTEIDQVTIDQVSESAEESSSSSSSSSSRKGSVYMKASICCDDRPELFGELKTALQSHGATIVEAEITSLGGRMKANFILRGNRQDNSTTTCANLKMALTRIVISSGSSTYSTRSKRQRFFYPTCR